MIETVAFLSYAHLDDAGSEPELSIFHDKLQSELRVHTGFPVHIFYDKKSISWGKRWADFIDHSLERVAFLIPILTPSYFQSAACKEEYVKFSQSEKSKGRRDLIRPIYYVKCRELVAGANSDPIVKDILSRQYKDWRNLRNKPADSTDVLLKYAELASEMADSFYEIIEASRLSDASKAKQLDKDIRAIDRLEHLLDREISYDSLVAYAVEFFPDLPVSREWTSALLEDIDVDRYKLIRDIDKEVKFASPEVSKYAAKRPDLFRYSTDYITKSLIFVDSNFRRTHSVAPETERAVIQAGITRY
jgi:hypothetical protein